VDIGRYARNRALRILPLYFAVVLVFFLVEGSKEGQPELWRYLTFSQYLERDAVHGAQALAPLWSVVVEIQYYVLLPIGAWVLTRLSRDSLKTAALIILALGLISLAIRIDKVVGDGAPPPPFWRLNMPANFLFFVPGMLLALFRLHVQRNGLAIPDRLRGTGLWIAAAVPFFVVPAIVSARLTPLVAIGAFLLVGACVLPLREEAPVRALSWKPLALMGVASYSLYVWHVPVLEVLGDIGLPQTPWTALALVAIPSAIVVAFASYRGIETPFLRLREAWSRDAASGGGAAATPTR
jgi:peptidoglycan/LPS O-acetylase OafA/YrhL